MPTYKTVIVDEKSSARNFLNQLLIEKSDVEVIAQCSSGLEAIEAINSLEPDLVFLEIEMSDLDGFEILERIQTGQTPFIVFTSSNKDYAVKAFEVEALDYIPKPVDRERVEKSLDRIRKRIHKEELSDQIGRLLPDFKESIDLKRFIIKQAGEYHLIRTKDIIWIESDGNYSRIMTQDRKFMIRYTLSGFKEQLNPNRFYRISRSKIVNLDYIAKIRDHVYGNYLIELENGTTLKMSKNYKRMLDVLKNF